MFNQRSYECIKNQTFLIYLDKFNQSNDNDNDEQTFNSKIDDKLFYKLKLTECVTDLDKPRASRIGKNGAMRR